MVENNTIPIKSTLLVDGFDNKNFDFSTKNYKGEYDLLNNVSNYDSDTSSSFTDNDEISIKDSLSYWAVQYQVSLVAVSALLSILKPYFPSLRVDSRTLLKTPLKYNINPLVSGGEYCHLGIEIGLRQIFKNSFLNNNLICFELQFNIDGLPLFKSSSSTLWPILGMI